MSLNFEWLEVALPLVLAIHNADEYARYEEFVDAYHPRLSKTLTSRPAIRYATTALTVFVALLAGLALIYKESVFVEMCKVSIFALFMNAISHCGLSLKRRRVLPGTYSAVFLVIPYSIIAIMSLRGDAAASYSQLAILAALGLLTAPLAVFLFLWLGYGLSRLEAGATSDRWNRG